MMNIMIIMPIILKFSLSLHVVDYHEHPMFAESWNWRGCGVLKGALLRGGARVRDIPHTRAVRATPSRVTQ